jgi:hypothetical protein
MEKPTLEFVPTSVPNWPRWIDRLPNDMPDGATVADTDAILEAVKKALSSQGYSIK